MPYLVPLAIAVLVLAVLALVIGRAGKNRSSLPEFIAKALSEGFTMMEATRLREAVSVAGVADRGRIFNSPKELDRVIAAMGGGDAEGSREVSRLLDKLFALRKKLEFEQPRYQLGVRSSAQLGQGQRLRILVPGLGVFYSTLIDNNPRFMVLSWPLGMRLPKGFVWKGKKVSIYFWRRDDAAYVFDSYVLDDLRIRDVPVIHVAHSESLLRAQKRRSVRARTTIPAYLYLLRRIEGAFEKAEIEPGLRSRLADLSEDGFAVVIGGKAKTGLLVKVQFAIGTREIVMSGTVKSVDYDRTANLSTMHVEAVSPSPRTRNAIRSFVYGSRSERSGAPLEAEG